MRNKGFTIIEAIVVVCVFTIILGAMMGSIVMIYRTHGYTMDQSIAIDEARKGVEMMAKEIRAARYADNGAYPIERGTGKQFIFYSDIDNDGQAERVRYFFATLNSGSQAQECATNAQDGFCDVNFANFLTGSLISAQMAVSVEGDLDQTDEYADIFVDGIKVGDECKSGCSHCSGGWQGTMTYDVTTAAADNALLLRADSSNRVHNQCNWGGAHSLRARFVLGWTEEIPSLDHQFRKGVIQPQGDPAAYPLDQEQVTTVSSYVRNAPPIFQYYDKNGGLIDSDPAVLKETTMMRLLLIVNANPQRPPSDYELEQYVQLRNLRED